MIVVTALYLILLIVCVFCIVKGLALRIRDRKNCVDNKILDIILPLVAFALLVVQVIAVIMYASPVSGNLRYIKSATLFYESGSLAGNDGLMIIWGIVAKILHVHPMIIVFTCLPVIMIPFYYVIYYLLLSKLTDGRRSSVFIGLIAIELINIWGYQSQMFVPATMLLSYGTQVCFIVHGVLPMLLYVLLSHNLCYVKETDEGRDTNNEACDEIDGDDYQEEWDMKKHKIINARNLAIAMGVLTLMLIAFVFILNNKINTLHAATANLQRDLSERTSIYEFVAPSGTVEGYLIKGSDGSLTMIGGGSAENAQALAEFIGSYGNDLTNWYLYETDEDDMGAYASCILEKGVTTQNVYVLNRTQIEGIN